MRALFLLVIVACGHPQPPPPNGGSNTVTTDDAQAAANDGPVALDQDLPRLATRAVRLYEDVAAAFATAGEDCTAATTMLRTLTATHAEVVAANGKVMRDGRGMQLKIALRAHEDKLDAAAKAIVGGKTLPACSRDDAFAKAYEDLVSAP
jgi:hypothetical protein